jgi:hypothetical protein
MDKVENLKKITLKLEAGSSLEIMDLDLDNPEFDFIFGLGPEGMSPFEYELVEKHAGQVVLLQLKAEILPAFFEHLHLPIINLFKQRDEIFLKVTIQKVKPADHREIVKAMADMTAHGHDCDCGCGC